MRQLDTCISKVPVIYYCNKEFNIIVIVCKYLSNLVPAFGALYYNQDISGKQVRLNETHIRKITGMLKPITREIAGTFDPHAREITGVLIMRQ